jgi:hypothetical protein
MLGDSDLAESDMPEYHPMIVNTGMFLPIPVRGYPQIIKEMAARCPVGRIPGRVMRRVWRLKGSDGPSHLSLAATTP